MANKIKVRFNSTRIGKRRRYFCYIGDVVHDGLMGTGSTKGAAAIDFIKKLNKDDQFGIYDEKQTI